MFSQARVKYSVHGGGGSLSQHAPQVTSPGGSLSSAGVSVQEEGSLCPGGRGSLSRGVSVWWVFVQGDLCLGWGLCPGEEGGGLCPRVSRLGRPPPYVNERAVRILLECILVVDATAVAVA